MIAALLAVTHLAAFLLGAYVCYRVVLRYGRRVTFSLSEDDMADPRPDEKRHIKFPLLVIVALFVVIVVGGVQAAVWQHQASDNADKLATAVKVSDHQRGCLNRWADDFSTAIAARTEVGARLRNAQKRKDHADDRVTDVFVAAFITKPPPPEEELKDRFAKALEGYVKARDHLAAVLATVETTATQNPYPVLDLDCPDPLKAGEK